MKYFNYVVKYMITGLIAKELNCSYKSVRYSIEKPIKNNKIKRIGSKKNIMLDIFEK